MVLFAKALKLPPDAMVRAIKGALLHDVGKLVVPMSVLGKPGPLTPEERKEMEKHVLLGAQIVAESQLLREAAPIVAAHHEHYDGSGYPKGLKGEDIPYEARMFALIDVFDALISARVYKSASSVIDALAIMAKGRGSQFDPVLFDRFAELAPDFARQMPKEESAVMTMLTDGLAPYLDRFFLGQAIADL
jgi:putative nucleotidyltransferase with HDIG domain